MMDITMPEMDGIQALKKIKESDAGANIIMCSAMGQMSLIMTLINAASSHIKTLFAIVILLRD